MSPENVKLIAEKHKSALLDKPNVVGVGLGLKEVRGKTEERYCVAALVSRKLPKAALAQEAMVPHDLDGIGTDVIEVGDLRAQDQRVERVRPALGGVSVAHYKVTAGTLGCVVSDRRTGQRLLLSNNHVLANSNEANFGDPILQPGPMHGGHNDKDEIASLERYVPLVFMVDVETCHLARIYVNIGNFLAQLVGSSHRLKTIKTNPQATNRVDAAVAVPLKDNLLADEIMGIGKIGGVEQKPALGMSVRKSGSTSGVTYGVVRVVDATVQIGYENGKMARFEDQIITTPMSQGGDSGSLLFAADSDKVVGLLFAGSDQATTHSPIQFVLDALEVDFEIGS